MKSIKMRGICAAVTGALLFGFGANAMADSTTDIVNALVAKGVLTEEEGALLNKGRTDEAAGQAKALKKAGKLKVSDAIDSATIYGDVRARFESRSGTGVTTVANTDYDVNDYRGRYKMTLGVKTQAGKWDADIAVAMGSAGRSDNATFGRIQGNGTNGKDWLYIKRASIGWDATDWLRLEAGRIANPLYTTPMLWDADLTWDGFAEKAKFNIGSTEVFLTAAQMQYEGEHGVTSNPSTELFAFQAGAKLPLTDKATLKVAPLYTFRSSNHLGGNVNFKPNATTAGNGEIYTSVNSYATNDLNTIEVPFEINAMAMDSVGVKLFGDYQVNMDADQRAIASALSTGANGSSDSDARAWMLGLAIGSAKDLKSYESGKMAKGDWSARIWYQEVGVWSADANLVDSDYMDSRVNTKGVVLKTQYNIEDNVFANLAYGHASRLNSTFGTAGAGDIAANWKDFDLLQLDVTYKF
jgi:hypothetical protein